MKKLIFILLITLPIISICQDVPLDSMTNKVCYSGIVNVDSTTKDVIYSKAREWFTVTFASANDVIQMDSKDQIIGKAFQNIYVTSMGMQVKTRMFYTVKIYIKDNKYRYEITDIYYKSYPTAQAGSYTSYPEDWFIPETKMLKKNGEAKPLPKSYKDETIKGIEGLVAGINAQIKKPVAVKSDW